MSKKVLAYVITNIGYNDNHIYKCYILIDNNGNFIRRESSFEAVNEHVDVPNGIYNERLTYYYENGLRNKAAELENASKSGQSRGVCSRCIMTLYSDNDYSF